MRKIFINQSALYGIESCLSKPISLDKEITTPEIEIKYSSIENFDIFNPVFVPIIKDFIVVLKKNFKDEDLKNFYNNINELKLKNQKMRTSSGQYKIDKNAIVIEKNLKVSSIRGILFHELFHMASSTYEKGRRYSGFSQRTKSKRIVIGNGINEGYTEILAHRLSSQKFPISYPLEYNIVLQLEDIVGKENMAKLYLNADLKGLINKLKEYSDEYEILEFITSVDQLQNYYQKKSTYIDNKNDLKNAYRFIIKTYIRKQELEYSRKNITKQELEYSRKNITKQEFFDRLGEYIYNLKKEQYDANNNDISLMEIIEILETVIDENEFNEKINKKLYSIYIERN